MKSKRDYFDGKVEDYFREQAELRRPLTAAEKAEMNADPMPKVIDRSYAYAKFADTQAAAATDASVKRGWRMVARFSRAAGEEAMNFDSADQAKIARFRAAVRRTRAIIENK